ncbi:polyketide synthase PksN [Pseudoduganella flava]|nr:SDR family NAD(P)-dependent oxidoreductase [Pseudoduganella flava]TWI44010.1 polyketide synthase PksN [Pseudoduganella flava]
MSLEWIESHLKALVATLLPEGASRDVDVQAPFGELGIDSFRVLKIIKALEGDFGVLPKTLLFEHFNIDSLARYFAEHHGAALATRMAAAPQAARRPAAPQPAAMSAPAPASIPVAAPEKTPIRLFERDLPRHPELAAVVAALFERHKNEGCVSRGTRNIAPNLFIGSARKGYFNYSRSNDLILVYAYTGPEDYFAESAAEMQRYCVERGFQLNIFVDAVIEAIDGVPFSATPFGALQRVCDIRNFTLEGGAMRRLRYQVQKFEKVGACRTAEYRCGTDPRVDQDIAAVIDRWCAAKTMVNPLIHIVREEILAGTLHAQHRIFLTYLNDKLQNVILISRMNEQLNGYLMDLEFYGSDMPLGGLEFAIAKIIEQLAAEGCDMLSMGGTYGVRLEASPHADPDVDRILDDLHRQNIFNDEGNLQFKNKFRCENRTIYLCRPAGSGRADNVVDIIMMIADPAKAQTSDEENHNAAPLAATPAAPPSTPAVAPVSMGADIAIAGVPRTHVLARYGYNPLNVPADQVEFDLKTDSWAQLETPFVGKRMRHLRAQLQQSVDVEASLRAMFPFAHNVLTDAGRAADRVFCKAWERKGIVPQNLLFPTSLYHQIDNGFTPCELPEPSAFQTDAATVFKGNVDVDALRQRVERDPAAIAYVCIDLGNNGTGGQGVSLAHLHEVKELLGRHGIALVLDVTRVLENAACVIEHEAGQASRPLWDVARDLLSCADVVIGSLAKDFCIDRGGIIASNDEALLRRCRAVIEREGGGLDVVDRKLAALALADRTHIETQVRRRIAATRSVWTSLAGAGMPVVHPAGGHCVLVDVKRIAAFAGLADPVAAFVAWLFVATGIRAGAHSVGMQKGTALNGLVRLAIPVGMKGEQAEELARRIVAAFADLRDIPEVVPAADAPAGIDVHAEYRLVGYHRPSGAQVEAGEEKAAVVAEQVVQPVPAQPPRDERAAVPIAIVGMSGRYPQARDLDAFWDNLRQGRDCVTDMPAERLARRQPGSRAYRGGFIDDVDRFDSLFFNISPREAEVLDPQERIFLEVAWEALEDAGYYPELLGRDGAPRNVGVFVGAVWAMYQMVGVEEKLAGNDVNPNSFLWSIANRVSFWMNLTGPSMTVDTACSSSLTALHLACAAIQAGDCDSALVGGVNLDLHQHKFDINHAGGALSPDGVCRTFGAGANGYVAGEGAGALFLKPLDRALADRDQVYGVIRGVSVNHGGRTSGYTVPNPKAQGELVAQALSRSGVDPRSIGYVEAHGTGTELGDPIEIAGLRNAFADAQPGSCAIGSVKTNIGHLEAAAGVVGVSKVLLQMKYRQLVPSLHAKEANPYIDFSASPFVVQQRLAPWPERDVDGVRVPLRAGVSSFGAGGANAHVVLESWDIPGGVASPSDLRVFPLSARTEAELREMAQRLRTHLQRDFVRHDLADVAFTLQSGRKSFEHRLAVVASSVDELVDLLGRYVDGRTDSNVLTGQAKQADGIAKLLSGAEQAQFVALLVQGGDPHKLAGLWAGGLLPDCRGFDRGVGRRTSLPTYPFADKRHWIGTGRAIAAATTASQAVLHPLIDSNESTFQQQLFRKTFRADEFFLHDHVVSGVPTLPGTAYLDLARKAGELAAGRPVASVRNVTWVSPLAVRDGVPTEAWVELKPAPDAVLFEVFSTTEDGARRLHAQGKLRYAGPTEPRPDEYIDLAAIRARCTGTIAASEAYPLFGSLGMQYGPSFQVLREVRRGDTEVLGELVLPEARGADFDQFVLHPCLLDAAMQAGVMAQLREPNGEMKVPYSIGEVEILHPLPRTCYSYVTKAGNQRAGGVSREDVAIVDATGKVLARIREAVGVPLAGVHGQAVPDDCETLYYAHDWQAAPLPERQTDVATLLLFDRDDALWQACTARGIDATLVMPGSTYAADGKRVTIDPADPAHYARLIAMLRTQGGLPAKICFAWGDQGEAADAAALQRALELGVYAVMAFCQALLKHKPTGRVQLLYVAGTEPQDEAFNGFARSLRLEQPKFDCKVLQADREAPDALADLVLAELHADAQQDATVRVRDGIRTVRTLRRVASTELAAASDLLKEEGVYLITGGAGGLGLIFADMLARRYRARLVLTGRSQLDEALQRRLDALCALGAEVLYVAADVAQADDVQRVLAEARARFGRIDGIVHAAGVLRDSLLRKKTREQMQAVLAPKVAGTFHLDAATRGDALDFFAMFSSLAALGGNTGQCDYAYANHYMDSFAARREALRAAGQRSGRTVSLNWSLWADGGMKLDEQTELFFRRTLGIRPLATQVGVQAFTQALGAGLPQVAVLEGERAKIEHAWGLATQEVAEEPQQQAAAPLQAPTPAAGGSLVPQVTQALGAIAMDLLKLSADELSYDSILLELGFDSVGLAAFANAVNARYGLDINPVLFFEYPSINAIAGVLAAEHGDAVARVHAVGAPATVAPAAAPVQDSGAGVATSRFAAAPVQPPAAIQPTVADTPADRYAAMPIAIVGIAGTMPRSPDLEAFWDNLKNARDLVSEIPRDRWIWEDHDGNPQKEPNKSYSRWGGFMDEVDKFDPLFFGITPREAEMMDPQQRLFIEAVWRAVEDAGHKVSELSGTRTGLFVGVSSQDYIDVLAENQSALDGYSASGNSHSILANRISYLLNLRGPSAPIDTACSSSLIALHRAIESIHAGNCEMALVGGVQVMLTPVAHISLSAAGMLSTDGKCKTFDKDANGYVRGEGVGAVFIKPLARAEADGDHVYAVIRASAENHGGRVTNLTAPNPKAQAELLTEAYERAGIDPSTVGYIECHGTGTSLGDPIEIQALKKAFADLYRQHGNAAPAAPHCGLSSVKTNIGHLEPAAGIASLLKVLLAMRHREIPALLHFDQLNPYIDLQGSPFYIVDKTVPWQAPRGADGTTLPRRAGVSSFGWGGANAHIVLEEYVPPARAGHDPQGALPIVLSAKNADRLRDHAANLLAWLERHDVALADLAYTLQAGRDAMSERLGFTAASLDEVRSKLHAFVQADGAVPGVLHGRAGRGKDELGLIGDDDIRASVVEQLGAAHKWDRLLELWVKGVELDWAALAGTQGCRRVALPTYPFARERYWVEARPRAAQVQAQAARPGQPAEEAARRMLFEEYWEPRPAGPVRALPADRQTIVFADETQRRLLATADDAGQLAGAVFVYPADAYEQVSERVFRCPVGDVDSLRRVLASVQLAAGQSLGIVHAWARRRGEPGVHALFQLFTAVRDCGRPVAHVTLVGAYDPADVDTCWDHAWIGFERSLKLHLARTRIALLYTSHGETVAQLLDAVHGSGAIWYDGTARKVLACRPLTERHAPPPLKQGGAYLITGGAGALGMKVAQHLATAYRAQLLLVGRRPADARIEGELAALRRAGAVEVHYSALDLGNASAVVAWAEQLPFPLSGVIHAAGVESAQPFYEKTPADIAAVLDPKTAGTLALDAALAREPLDFICCFSSSSALLGDFGACDYAVANRFQMAYARHRALHQDARGRMVVINWPLWQEGGMGMADPAQAAQYLKRTGLEALGTKDGLATWEELLAAPQDQTLVIVGQPARVHTLLERLYAGTPAAMTQTQVPVSPAAPLRLASHQLDQLRQLIKADLLNLQAMEE